MTGEKSVLIVEDGKDIQALLRSLFEMNGYQVACAGHGAEALTYLNFAPRLPAVILLDIMMPVMDGFQFRSEQLKDPRLAAIATVVMTSDINGPSIAKQLGAAEFFKKPFPDFKLILNAVEKLVLEKERADQSRPLINSPQVPLPY